MFCPKCSQPQVSDDMQFCSHCGLTLNNLKEIVRGQAGTKASQTQAREEKLSPRQKGVRQGSVLMVLSLILIPAYILLAPLFPAHDRLVESAVSDTPFEKVSQLVLLTIFLLGVARVLYARLFEPGADLRDGYNETEIGELKGPTTNHELPPAQSIPVSGFGSWRINTGEMVQPEAVIGHPTKSLEEE